MRPYLEITKFNYKPIEGQPEGKVRNYKIEVEVIAFSPQDEIEEGSVRCVHYGNLIGGAKTVIEIFPGIGTIRGSGTCQDPYVISAEFETAKVPYGLWLCMAHVIDNKGQKASIKRGLKF